jgi:hypothetical protein
MPIFKNKNNDFILFIHIPKSGGTSINTIIERASHLHGISLTRGSLPVAPQHFHAALLSQVGYADIAHGSFAITREPLNRLVSEYQYRCKNSPFIKKLFDFETFARFSIDEYDNNSYILDNHIRPQNQFVLPDTKTYKYEDGLFQAMEDISGSFFVEVKGTIRHENRSPHITVKLSQAGYQKVLSFYADDYKRFGYLNPDTNIASSSVLFGLWCRAKASSLGLVYRCLKKLRV